MEQILETELRTTRRRRRVKTRPRKAKSGKRDREGTRLRILMAATHEFSTYGFGSARVDRITKRARTFQRMLYYYFGDKKQLFRFVLEKCYEDLLAAEKELDLRDADPVEGIRKLVGFTWRYYVEHPEFIRLLNAENVQRGVNVSKSLRIKELSLPFVGIVRDLVARGAANGVFRSDADPKQMYITIAALCYFYLSNRYTLSHWIDPDLMTDSTLTRWQKHITEVVLDYLYVRKALPATPPALLQASD